MAETIATGYIQLMPSAKGMKQAIEKELKGSVSGPLAKEAQAAGAQSGQILAKTMATQVAASSGTITAAVTQATAKSTTGIVASMKAAVQAYGGTGAVLTGLGQRASQAGTQLRGLVQGSSAMSTAAGGMKAGLLGVSGLLGGPWGIAIAGGALALNSFAEAQKNASDEVQSYLATLSKTGQATQGTAAGAAGKILGNVSAADMDRLKGLGVTLQGATQALTQGGPALDAYLARIHELANAQVQQASGMRGGVTGINATKSALLGLASELEHQRTSLEGATTAWNVDSQAKAAAETVARNLGLATDEVTGGLIRQAAAQRNASAAATIFSLGMDSISAAADRASAYISAIPSNVRIRASATGLNDITRQADLAFAAMMRLLTLSNAANNIKASGERHGADVSSASQTAVGQAAAAVSAAQAAADRARQQVLDQIAAHNRGAGSTSSRGGGGGGGRVSAASQARTDLLSMVNGGTFLADLVGGDRKSIGSTGSSLISLARTALSGSKETSLVALLKKDTSQLQSLATKRATIATRLQSAQQSLENLRQEKASTVSSVTQGALGNLVGARSVGGVLRVLTKQVEKVKAFRANLGILAKRGLPKVFLQQLVAAGLDGAFTAAALVRANDADFATVTSLTTQLNTQATGLGNDAGSLLYDSGIAAAQGLIRGLKSQEAAVDAQMLRIAKSMQTAIKRALGIKSPSTVFAEIGRYTGQGFEHGIRQQSPSVNRAVAEMVKTRGYQNGGATTTAPGAGMSAPITVVAGANVMETAHAVSNELMWRAKR